VEDRVVREEASRRKVPHGVARVRSAGRAFGFGREIAESGIQIRSRWMLGPITAPLGPLVWMKRWLHIALVNGTMVNRNTCRRILASE